MCVQFFKGRLLCVWGYHSWGSRFEIPQENHTSRSSTSRLCPGDCSPFLRARALCFNDSWIAFLPPRSRSSLFPILRIPSSTLRRPPFSASALPLTFVPNKNASNSDAVRCRSSHRCTLGVLGRFEVFGNSTRGSSGHVIETSPDLPALYLVEGSAIVEPSAPTCTTGSVSRPNFRGLAAFRLCYLSRERERGRERARASGSTERK